MASSHETKVQEPQPWTHAQDDLLDNWCRDAHLQSILHRHAAKYYYFWNRVIGAPVIVLAAVTSTGTFATYKSDDDLSNWIRFFIGMALITSFILSTLYNYLDFGGLSRHHLTSAALYEKVERNIERQLAAAPRARAPPTKFLVTLEDKLADLRESCPIVAHHISDKYVNQIEHLLRQVPRAPLEEDVPPRIVVERGFGVREDEHSDTAGHTPSLSNSLSHSIPSVTYTRKQLSHRLEAFSRYVQERNRE